jgi:hypothetical protein
VDACDTNEGYGEMVFFQTGQTALSTTSLSNPSTNIVWSTTNQWLGLTTNQTYINNVNATITGGGLLIPVPIGGSIPANANVVIITGGATTTSSMSFTNLTDTLYVLFQNNPANISGHFTNSGNPGIRSFVMNLGVGCKDSVSYTPNSLPDYSGSGNGGYVLYSASGTPTYLNYGCRIPFTIQSDSVRLTAPSPVQPVFLPIGPICQGVTPTPPMFPNTSTNGYAGTWNSTAINTTATTSYTFTHAAGTCVKDTTINVIVNPAATANAGAAQTVCAGSSITLSGSVGGGATSGIWSAPSGTFANASSLTSNYTPSITSGSVTLTLTSNDPDGTGPCVSVTSTVLITVNPLPVISATSITCAASGTSYTVSFTASNGNGTYTVNGVTGTWSGTTFTSSSIPTGSTAHLRILKKRKMKCMYVWTDVCMYVWMDG